jgi:hypothetical protein
VPSGRATRCCTASLRAWKTAVPFVVASLAKLLFPAYLNTLALSLCDGSPCCSAPPVLGVRAGVARQLLPRVQRSQAAGEWVLGCDHWSALLPSRTAALSACCRSRSSRRKCSFTCSSKRRLPRCHQLLLLILVFGCRLPSGVLERLFDNLHEPPVSDAAMALVRTHGLPRNTQHCSTRAQFKIVLLCVAAVRAGRDGLAQGAAV